MRHALHCRCPRADYGDALIGQLVQTALGRAAGVVVVPAAGMESMALKVADSRNAREFGAFKGPLASETKRARMTSPRSVLTNQRRSSSLQRNSFTPV